jgi:hypothetical protein
VKRCSGEDTLGVAPRENSSVPGQFLYKNLFLILGKRFLCISTSIPPEFNIIPLLLLWGLEMVQLSRDISERLFLASVVPLSAREITTDPQTLPKQPFVLFNGIRPRLASLSNSGSIFGIFTADCAYELLSRCSSYTSTNARFPILCCLE